MKHVWESSFFYYYYFFVDHHLTRLWRGELEKKKLSKHKRFYFLGQTIVPFEEFEKNLILFLFEEKKIIIFFFILSLYE